MPKQYAIAYGRVKLAGPDTRGVGGWGPFLEDFPADLTMAPTSPVAPTTPTVSVDLTTGFLGVRLNKILFCANIHDPVEYT